MSFNVVSFLKVRIFLFNWPYVRQHSRPEDRQDGSVGFHSPYPVSCIYLDWHKENTFNSLKVETVGKCNKVFNTVTIFKNTQSWNSFIINN